jgi:dihydrofolate synthase / folylpolyglutamate synthase
VEAAAAPLLGVDRDGIVVELPSIGEARVGLRGRHQAANVAVADAVLDALAAAGIASVSGDARRRGYAAATWPGRLELIRHQGSGPAATDVLLDGAHNPAGAAVLATALEDLRPFLDGGADRPRPSPVTLLTAMMGDKDVAGVVAPLAASPVLAGGRVVCTQLPEERSLPAAELAAAWSAASAPVEVAAEPDPRRALERVLREARGPVVVAGSLYLVGTVRSLLVDDPSLRDPDDPPVRR